MDYIIWGLIAAQAALLAYQFYVYKKVNKGGNKNIKGWHFFSGKGVVITSFAIASLVVILHFLK